MIADRIVIENNEIVFRLDLETAGANAAEIAVRARDEAQGYADQAETARDESLQSRDEAVQKANEAIGAKDEVEIIGNQVSEDRIAIASDREAVDLARADVEEKAGIAEQAAVDALEALQEFDPGSYPKLQDAPNQFEILDDEGFLILAIRENGEIYPPTVKQKSISKNLLTDDIVHGLMPDSSSSNIFEIIDDEGYVIQVVNERGEQYPPIKYSFATPKEKAPATVLERSYKNLQADQVLKNAIWNQWIEPLAVWDGESLFFGGTGNATSTPGTGALFLAKRTKGTIQRKKIASIRGEGGLADDHNAGAILLDSRPGAEFPLMWFQAEHNTYPIRLARLESKEPENWDNPNFIDIPTSVAYPQPSRYGDEIFMISRLPGLPRPWRMAYSSDNGLTWKTKNIFSADASWLYCLSKIKKDKSGLNIAFHGHPIESSEQGIFFLELDFASGSIFNPADRENPIIPDVRAFMNDGNPPVDPFQVGLKLYTPVGTEITRLWDIGRNSNGNCFCLFNVIPANSRQMQNFNESDFRVTNFSIDDGEINYMVSIDEAGMPFERPAGNNFYFAGGCIIDDTNQIVTLKYKNQSQIDGGFNTIPSDGKTFGSIITITDSENIGKKDFLECDTKCMRPYSVADSSIFIYCDALQFEDYFTFQSDVVVQDLRDIL